MEKRQGQVKSYCVNQQIRFRWKSATAEKEKNPTHCHSLKKFIK